MSEDRTQLLETEKLIVRNSGEIPEITYYSSLYYLCDDKEGPGIVLKENEFEMLKSAAEERFRDILLRDLLVENRDKTIYRGVKRSIANWGRYKQFCERQNRDPGKLKNDVKNHLMLFLQNELLDISSNDYRSLVNCTFAELEAFIVELGIIDETDEYKKLWYLFSEKKTRL